MPIFSSHGVTVQRARAAMDKSTSWCATCLTDTDGCKVDHHPYFQCPSFIICRENALASPMCTVDSYMDWKRRVRYSRNTAPTCWRCHIPFMNDQVHAPKRHNNATCNPLHDDMVIPLAYYLFVSRYDELSAAFNCSWTMDILYADWLVRTEPGLRCTNAFRTFVWAMEELC